MKLLHADLEHHVSDAMSVAGLRAAQYVYCYVTACIMVIELDGGNKCIDETLEALMQEPIISSATDDVWDSDSCNIGSPTTACSASVASNRPFGELHSRATGRKSSGTAANSARVMYQVHGSAGGFAKYLHDAGSLQLLLVGPASTLTASATSTLMVAPDGSAQAYNGADQHPDKSQADTRTDEVAVGRVAVPLHDLAGLGRAEGGHVYGER